jgi:ATP-dependent Zn protease
VKHSLNCPRTEAERTKTARQIIRKASGTRFSVLDVAASVALTFFALTNPSTASIASQTTVPAQTGSAPLQNHVPEGDGYEGAAIRFAPAVSQDISFSQLLTDVDKGNVRDVVIQGPDIHGTYNNGSSFQTYAPSDPNLVKRLYDAKVQITAKPPGDNVPWFVSLLVSWLPFIALIGVWIFLSRQMQGGAGKAMGFGKSRAKMLTEAHGRVTFEDVAGVDEAKQDLQEIVEFLRDPGKFQRLGGRIPRGVLLVGPPGTGKTLIARAVAGEANVPFFTISGSDFVEMFVGVGASRVRDMFEQAKKSRSLGRPKSKADG